MSLQRQAECSPGGLGEVVLIRVRPHDVVRRGFAAPIARAKRLVDRCHVGAYAHKFHTERGQNAVALNSRFFSTHRFPWAVPAT